MKNVATKKLVLLELVWKLVRSIIALAVFYLLFIALIRMPKLLWLIIVLPLSLLGIIEQDKHFPELQLYAVSFMSYALFGAAAKLLPWGNLPLVNYFLAFIPLLIMLGYSLFLIWQHKTAQERIESFPCSRFSPEERLRVGVELGCSNYSGEEKDIESSDYDVARDTLRSIASVDSSGAQQAALKRLRYPDDADVLRAVASDAKSDGARIAAILMLPYPQEKETLCEAMAALPAYAEYDFSFGWPHEHQFEHVSHVSSSVSEDVEEETDVYHCDCGLKMTCTTTTQTTYKEYPGRCPMCGGEVLFAEYAYDPYLDHEYCTVCGATPNDPNGRFDSYWVESSTTVTKTTHTNTNRLMRSKQ